MPYGIYNIQIVLMHLILSLMVLYVVFVDLFVCLSICVVCCVFAEVLWWWFYCYVKTSQNMPFCVAWSLKIFASLWCL